MKKDLKTKSKYLSLILRHNPDAGSVVLDGEGWADIKDLIHNAGFTLQELEDIIANDDKRRYSFNKNKTKVRANQGHSLEHIKINFLETIPPRFLYHGTVQKYVDSIMKDGLKKQTRNYLHLSKDLETAISVGSRRGNPVILKINALDMYHDGYKFLISENGVYLIEMVPTKYITIEYR